MIKHYDIGGAQIFIKELIDIIKNDFEIIGLAVEKYRNEKLSEEFVLSGDFESNLRYLDYNCDIIITWGDFGHDLSIFTKPILFISIDSFNYTKSICIKYKDSIKYRVALSKAAGLNFDNDYTTIYSYIEEERLRGEPILGEGLRLGYLGRISPEKGLLESIELVKALPKEWVFSVGFDPINSEFEQYFLSELEKQIPNRYKLYNPGLNVGSFLKSINVLSVLSPREGFCKTSAEAFYCGVPQLANDTGIMGDVKHMLPDYHIANGDYQDMANQVIELHKNKNNNIEFYKEISTLFDKETIRQKWIELLYNIKKEI